MQWYCKVAYENRDQEEASALLDNWPKWKSVRSDRVISAIEIVVTTGVTIRRLECTVQPLYDLLEGTVLLSDCIVVGETNNLSDVTFERIFFTQSKLLRGKRISWIAVYDEFEVIRQLLQLAERHAHGKDTSSYATVVGDTITDNQARDDVNNKPNKALDFRESPRLTA